MNDWLKFGDDELSDYLNRELEYTDKGQLKSNTTNLITVLVNPLFCKEEKIIDGTGLADMQRSKFVLRKVKRRKKHRFRNSKNGMTILTNVLGVEIEREFGIQVLKEPNGRCHYLCRT